MVCIFRGYCDIRQLRITIHQRPKHNTHLCGLSHRSDATAGFWAILALDVDRMPVYYGLLKNVRRIYNSYISGCIIVTKMNYWYHLKAWSKIFCLSGFRPSPIAVLSRAEDMFDMTPISLDTLFGTAYRGLCCSTAHGKRQAAHHWLYCIIEVFETFLGSFGTGSSVGRALDSVWWEHTPRLQKSGVRGATGAWYLWASWRVSGWGWWQAATRWSREGDRPCAAMCVG